MWLVSVEAPAAHLLLGSPKPFLSSGVSYAWISYSSLVWHRNPDGGPRSCTASEKIQEGAGVSLHFHVALCNGTDRAL